MRPCRSTLHARTAASHTTLLRGCKREMEQGSTLEVCLLSHLLFARHPFPCQHLVLKFICNLVLPSCCCSGAGFFASSGAGVISSLVEDSTFQHNYVSFDAGVVTSFEVGGGDFSAVSWGGSPSVSTTIRNSLFRNSLVVVLPVFSNGFKSVLSPPPFSLPVFIVLLEGLFFPFFFSFLLNLPCSGMATALWGVCTFSFTSFVLGGSVLSLALQPSNSSIFTASLLYGNVSSTLLVQNSQFFNCSVTTDQLFS